MLGKKCKQCNSIYKIYPSEQEISFYCSVKCYAIGRIGIKRPDLSMKMLGENNFWFGKKLPNNIREKIRKKLKGNKNRWKGDKVGYRALHQWIVKKLGKPTKCERCKKSGLIGRKIHWANKSHKYKRDLSNWLRLCVKCHKEFDKRK